MAALSLLGILIFFLNSHFSGAVVDRSVTVNKGQSGFFSLNADDLLSENGDLEETKPNSGLIETENATGSQVPASNSEGIAAARGPVDPIKAVQPRFFFQRVQDIVASLALSVVMMGLRILVDYLLSYKNLFRFFRRIELDSNEKNLSTSPHFLSTLYKGIDKYGEKDIEDFPDDSD